MKVTNEDLLKLMKLSIGDTIKVDGLECVVTIKTLSTGNQEYIIEHKNGGYMLLKDFIGYEYDILPRQKRVGDLKCDDIPHSDCTTCPIKILCLDYGNADNQPFYEILEDYKSKSGEHFDQEIHDLLKARLNKEVK